MKQAEKDEMRTGMLREIEVHHIAHDRMLRSEVNSIEWDINYHAWSSSGEFAGRKLRCLGGLAAAW